MSLLHLSILGMRNSELPYGSPCSAKCSGKKTNSYNLHCNPLKILVREKLTVTTPQGYEALQPTTTVGVCRVDFQSMHSRQSSLTAVVAS
jgi:hypothetical protein